MEKVFVDPVIHSPRVERFHLMGFGGLLLLVLGGIWAKWGMGPRDPGSLRLALMISAALAAAGGAGYYMMRRNRQAQMAWCGLTVGPAGIRSRTLAGEVFVNWDEVMEIRIGLQVSRSRAPDVLIKTRKGYLAAFLRWMDRDQPLPQPRLRNPGRAFVYPDGKEIVITPENSPLAAALKAFAPPEKIKEGELISL